MYSNISVQFYDAAPAAVRRSNRSYKGVPPARYEARANLVKEEPDPRTVTEALSRPDKDDWKKAMNKEIESLPSNGTWEIVPRPREQNIVSCKWVFKTKRNVKGEVERYKARLVARGFSQKYGVDYDEVFAPVVRQATFRTLLTLAGRRDMVVKHFDAKTASLNGKLKERIYMSQPDGYIEKNKKDVCRLIKGIYGLKQAAKVWHDQLSDYLKGYGFVQSIADPCLYIRVDATNIVYLIIYVDDFLIAAEDIKLIDQVADFLRQKFQLKDLGILSYYLGMEIRRNADGIFCIKQSTHIQSILNRFGLQDAKTSRIPLDQGYLKIRQINQEPTPNSERYQQLIGSLLLSQ